MFKKLVRTIEIDISPEQFVYRKAQQELTIATRGYINIKKARGRFPSSYIYNKSL